MKNRHSRVINRYPAWKYVVLVVTLILLALSAIPTWFGEQPAIQVRSTEQTGTLSSIASINQLLVTNDITARQIDQQGDQYTIIFDNENEQSQARALLDGELSDTDTITFSYVSVAPNWLSNLGLQPIKLGLDLRGGVQFLLNVDLDTAFNEQRVAIADEVRSMLVEERIRGVRVETLGTDSLEIRAQSPEGMQAVRDFVRTNYQGWDVENHSRRLVVKPSEQFRSEFRSNTIAQNLKIMRDRIEELGITEAMVQRQGENSIRIELPGVQDPAQAKNVIGATASLAFHQVKSPSERVTRSDYVVQDNDGNDVVLVKRPVLTGEHIVNARAGVGEMGMAEVNISLDHAGGRKMSDFSSRNIGEPMATVYREYTTNVKGDTELNERVISVATIQSQLGSQFRITGAGSMADAQELALLLRAGSLTAPVTIVEERTIGASLGAENIKNGFASLALGLGLTLTFMLFGIAA